jgi:hypothetical protein
MNNNNKEPIKIKAKAGEIEEILKQIRMREKHNTGREPLVEEFRYLVKNCGDSSHIPLSKKWLGRFVHVKVEEVKE